MSFSSTEEAYIKKILSHAYNLLGNEGETAGIVLAHEFICNNEYLLLDDKNNLQPAKIKPPVIYPWREMIEATAISLVSNLRTRQSDELLLEWNRAFFGGNSKAQRYYQLGSVCILSGMLWKLLVETEEIESKVNPPPVEVLKIAETVLAQTRFDEREEIMENDFFFQNFSALVKFFRECVDCLESPDDLLRIINEK